MNKLHKFYQKGIVISFIIAFLVSYFAVTPIVKLILSRISDPAISALISHLISMFIGNGVLLYLFEKIVRTRVWRLFYPELCFDGKWSGSTTYTEKWTKTDGSFPIDSPLNEKEEIHIKQDCLSLKIVPSESDGFTWSSAFATLSDSGDLDILYEVTYKDKLKRQGYPSKLFGYEKMHVDRSVTAASKKPLSMLGEFKHCLNPEAIAIFSGEVEYHRDVDPYISIMRY
ncbi:MAG: hypothetical protein LBN02_09990 [Oscillospiraceae bacterium]|jgi:hypothetical protein|nr:hypothetical protein [Oscillospiraceae bacterium]